MSVRSARVGVGDWLSLAGAVGLVVDLFATHWFSYPSGWYAYAPATVLGSQDGWQALKVLGPVTAVVAVGAIITFATQALRRSPAVPIVLITLLTPAAWLVALALAIWFLLAPPSGALRHMDGGSGLDVDAGAYVGLGLSVLLAVGLFGSLRREGIAPADAPAEIETIKLGRVSGT